MNAVTPKAVYPDKLTAEEAVQKLYGKELYIIARTVYGETRGESRDGQSAVVHVILNRLRKQHERFGFTAKQICLKPEEFSYWKLSTIKDILLFKNLDLFMTVLFSINVYPLYDITKGATHYHADSILPEWAKGKTPCAIHDHHMFYNNIY